MLLSKILADMGYEGATIIREREFQYLALTEYTPGEQSLVFLDSVQYVAKLAPPVTMVLAAEGLEERIPEDMGVCVVERPRELFFLIHNFLSCRQGYQREEFLSEIGEGCTISPLASIAEKNVRIGRGVVVEEFAVIRENTVLQDGVIVRAGAVVGGQGFEYKRMGERTLLVEHAGGVIVEEGAEIKYNTCIDRAVYPWDDTVVGGYCRLDNLVHIGHAVKLGKCVLVAAGSVIAGRTTIGNNAWVGLNVTIANGLHIGENSRVNMGAVVISSVKDGEHVTGNIAIEHTKFMLNQARNM